MAQDVKVKAQVDRDTENYVALRPGLTIGKYEILSVLGHGGFGITYRARDAQLHRDIAIKEYLPGSLAVRLDGTTVLPRSTEVAEDFAWGRDRFLDEARTMARLANAPAVVRVHDFLEANGTAYVVMPLLEGETLEARLRRENKLPQAALERIVLPLLDGLDQVHAAGFLHRDIKPANIILAADGMPTLIDFGASRAAMRDRTQNMTAIFTPGFAPLEQFSAGKQGPWSDVYGLAATLYTCVAGKPPPNAIDRMVEDTMVPVARLGAGDYAPGLLAGIDAGLILKGQDRPQTIGAWRELLTGGDRSISAQTIVLPRQPLDLPSVAVARRSLLPRLAQAGVMLAAVCGAGFWAFGVSRSVAPSTVTSSAPMALAAATTTPPPVDNVAFDGPWNATEVCPPAGTTKGYTWKFEMEVKNGSILGQYGVKDMPSSATFTGQIQPDGRALISASGMTGSSDYNVNNVPTHGRIVFSFAAQFDGKQGSGDRVVGRSCHFTFVKQ